jgi:hypothetical protein
METHTINGQQYCQICDIKQHYPYLYTGCRSTYDFIKKHVIPKNECIKARPGDNGIWFIPEKFSTKTDKVFISMEYLDENLIVNDEVEEADDEVEEEVGYPPLPEPVILTDKEAFKGADGQELEVRVVGKRDPSNCFFNVTDVGKAFELKRLVDAVTDIKSAHEEGVHYQIFDISDVAPRISGSATEKIQKKKDTHYFTYLGLMKAIFSSRSADAEPFLMWATKTLFTAHLGTRKNKQLLAATLAGISPEGIRNMCSATSGITSCIYLFSLGTVKKLRKSMMIGDEYDDMDVVYKFGRTKNLKLRTKAHIKTFSKKGADIQLVYHGQIDIQHTSKAETSINHFMQGMNISFTYQKNKELIIASKKQLAIIKEYYDTVTELYRGRIKEMIYALEKKDHEIDTIKKDNEISMLEKDNEISTLKKDMIILKQEKDNKLLQKDNELLQKDNELLQKDNIILQLRLDAALAK